MRNGISYTLYYEDIDRAALCGAWADMDHSSSINGNRDFILNRVKLHE